MANPLQDMQVIMAIDISASMYTPDVKGKTRIEAIQEGVIALASNMRSLSSEGVPLYVFGHGARRVKDHAQPEDIGEIFSSLNMESRTDTHELIRLVNRDRNRDRNTLLIIATDGRPSDEIATREAIVEASRECRPSARDREDTDEFTILFYQIGSDSEATRYLQELDDDLVKKFGAKFDIVDAKTVDDIDGKNPFEIAMEALQD